MKSFACFLFCFLFALSSAVPGQTSADEADVVTAEALRASILGDSDRVRQLAEARRAVEREGRGEEPIASHVAALAAVTQTPGPDLKEWRTALSGYRREQVERSLERLVRQHEPRQRFREARKDRRYDRLRIWYNSVAGPVSELARGQIFALVMLPFDAVEGVFVGGRFLTPEQRRELVLARRAIQSVPEDVKLAQDTEGILAKWPDRRARLALLQAKLNAEEAHEDGRIFVADFWLERQMLLRDGERPGNRTERRVREEIAQQARAQRDSVTMLSGDRHFASTAEMASYGDVLRAFLAPKGEEAFQEAVRDYMVDHPTAGARYSVDAARAAAAWQSREPALAQIILTSIAESPSAGSWQQRAEGMLEIPAFGPEKILEDAKAKIDKRRREYILAGENPFLDFRSLTPEEARQSRQAWFYRARGLFINDTLARLLFLPLTGPFPKPELPDAAVKVHPSYFNTPEGQKWLRRVAKAQWDERRYENAAQTYERLGDFDRARRARQRAAREIEREAQNAPTPTYAKALYERLLSAYPNYRRRERVEGELAKATLEVESLTILKREELHLWPELLEETELPIPRTLLDGRSSTGRISRDGVAILRREAISYEDTRTGRRIELPFPAEQRDKLLQLLEPRRRLAQVGEELRKPMPRKRIPIAIEAGLLPGFDVGPGLVPLDPNLQERELYE